MIEENENLNNEEQVGRPRLLSILCVLTYISSALSILLAFLVISSPEMVRAYVENAPNYNETEKEFILKVVEGGWNYNLPLLLLSAGSLFGAILMWRLNKNGFHFYAISNIVILLLPTLILGVATDWGSILVTGSFIGMYAIHLKFMK